MQMLPLVQVEAIPWVSVPHLPQSCHPAFGQKWIHNVLTELKAAAIKQFGQYDSQKSSTGLVDLRSIERSGHSLILALVAVELQDTFAVLTESGNILPTLGA